eukprot:gene7062-7276_t
MVLPPQDIINQKLCSDYYVSGPSPSFEINVAMAASICQVIGSTMGSQQSKTTPSLQFCLNGTMLQVKVPLAEYYTITGTCQAAPAVPTAAAAPKPWAAQQQAASLLLLPLAHDFAASMSAYLPNAQIDIASAAQGLNAIKNDNEAASWWMENYLYCCSESCNDWLSSIGSALGYEAYIEGAVAVLVILVYLMIFKADRQRLDLYSIKGIANIAFEVNNSSGTAGPDGTAGNKAKITVLEGKASKVASTGMAQPGDDRSRKTTEDGNNSKWDFSKNTGSSGGYGNQPNLADSPMQSAGVKSSQEIRENSRGTARLVSFADTDNTVAPVSAWQED